jgi:hypothetical protein
MQSRDYASIRRFASRHKVMHNDPMRTTVTLDDDAYELAVLRAKGKGISLGAALGEFIREAQEARLQAKPLPNGLVRGPKGMLMFAPSKSSPDLSTETVKKIMLEVEEEDDERRAFPVGRQHSRRAV